MSACGWSSRRAILHSLERRDELLAPAGHVVLWFEHDLYDQLQLLQVLATHAPGLRELVRPDVFLGELEAPELEALSPERREIADGILDLGRAGRAAFTAPEPAAIEAFLATDTLRRRRVGLAPPRTVAAARPRPFSPTAARSRARLRRGQSRADGSRPAVLAGEADRVAYGLERQLGGTDLRPDNAWRWDPVSRCCVAPR